MKTNNLSSVFTDLFTAPIEATLHAEERYRDIWIGWLKNLKSLVDSRVAANPHPDDQQMRAFIESQLSLAPIMRLEARIDVGVNLRVTSVRQSEAGGSLGLQLGVLQAAGTFSFASQDTQESVVTARATYALANSGQISLKDFLEKAVIPLATPAHFDSAIEFLKSKPKTNDE